MPEKQGADASRSPVWLRRAGRSLLSVAGVAVLLLLLASSIVFVDETENVIVFTLGRISAVYDDARPEGDRGLHVKWPWPVGTVERFDRRQQLFDPPGREMFTRDKKNITVTSFVCWRIAEPARYQPMLERPVVKFYRRLRTLPGAEGRLDERLRSIVSSEFGRVELAELLAVTNSEAGPTGASPLEAVSRKCLAELRRRSRESQSLIDDWGLDVLDVRIKRINLPEGNRLAVYERMRTERQRIAEQYRSAGKAEKTRIESQARRQSEELLARANADAERIRGEGEAEAIGILNRAHAEDPEFYEFQRTLDAYTKILNDRTTLVLSASSKLFKVLTEGVGSMTREPNKATAEK